MKKIFLCLGAMLMFSAIFTKINAKILELVEITQDQQNILRIKCKPVDKFDDELTEFLDNMHETMKSIKNSEHEETVGLSAPQVGQNIRIFLVKVNGEIKEFVNPEIIEQSKEKILSLEGCASVSDLIGIVLRPNKIKVKAFDRNGNEFCLELKGLNATFVAHENDHLDGILFTDLTNYVVSIKNLSQGEIIKMLTKEIAKFRRDMQKAVCSG